MGEAAALRRAAVGEAVRARVRMSAPACKHTSTHNYKQQLQTHNYNKHTTTHKHTTANTQLHATTINHDQLRSTTRRRAKYELHSLVRTTVARDDEAFQCVYQMEDGAGERALIHI